LIGSDRRTVTMVDTSLSPYAKLRPVQLDSVRLLDEFWEPRRELNRKVTLASQFDYLENTGRMDNFRRAAGKIDVPFKGLYFNDSDIYKWLEAASWELLADSEVELEQMVDSAISEIEAAQQPDGYLDTYFTYERASERWKHLTDKHELYVAGHLIQAAVAHHRATGSERLLNVARRFADHICAVFGPEEEGKLLGTDGHEEIEMALVELYRDTGDRKYLDQAQFFVDMRGHGLVSGKEYHQDHKPFRELREIVGHAVRAMYLNCAGADLYAETGESALLEALEGLWQNMTTRRMYVNGAIGSRFDYEAFGKDYELPNERAYAESCAAIGSVMWNWRMLSLEGDARYADLMEHTLYNAVLPGISLDGEHYFYENPLADDGSHRRQPWFYCACCPPNIARLLASLPGYFYSISSEGLWVHLYAEGEADISLDENHSVRLRQRTRYPWDGDVTIEIAGEGAFSLILRIPSWSEEGASITVNDAPSHEQLVPGSYAEIRRAWRPGDTVLLHLPMTVRRVESHPHVTENNGKVALMRGPILYCVEQADNSGVDPRDVVLQARADFPSEFRAELLGGVTVIEASAEVVAPDKGWEGRLYRTARLEGRRASHGKPVRITAVPYYAWANREPGPMRVWLQIDASVETST
jgi:uncharacterized protein